MTSLFLWRLNTDGQGYFHSAQNSRLSSDVDAVPKNENLIRGGANLFRICLATIGQKHGLIDGSSP